MAGLILLAAVALFIVLLVWLSGIVTKRLPISVGGKALLRVVIVSGAFPLMVADEIIGRYQFEALCRANGIEGVNIALAQGKSVKVHYDYSNWKDVPRTIIPIEEVATFIKGADDNKVLAQYTNYRADGGWLMRYSGLGMGARGPMLFDGSGCDWAVTSEIFRSSQIIWIKN